ncbi:MAG TPA: type IV CRISPR-associated DEAD/DEAH-box helicase Csf4 [Nevskiaceae bacterium]|nr:type IV CRISPR-associated DEAD/DEAH-box helicase Csf4 [Nevskiaceae bacterium]
MPTNSIVTRTISLPLADLELLKAKGAVSRVALSLAIEEGTKDRPILPVPQYEVLHHAPVRVPGDKLDRLREIAKAKGLKDLADGTLLSRLIITALRGDTVVAIKPATPFKVDPTLLSTQERTARPEQLQFFADIAEANSVGRIILAEAATGVGKGLVIAAAAHMAASAGKRVVVASPTHLISRQTRSDLAAINRSHGEVKFAVVYGRREFVSSRRLSEMLDEAQARADLGHAQIAEARKWLDRQIAAGDNATWLSAELEAHCPGLAREYALHNAEVGEPGEMAYQRQFVAAEKAPIVFASHAMLAHDTLARVRSALAAGAGSGERDQPKTEQPWYIASNEKLISFEADRGVLPNFEVLLVDEAHLLERAFAEAASASVSVRMMVRRIDKLANSSKSPTRREAASTAKKCFERLEQLSRWSDSRLSISKHTSQPAAGRGAELVAELLAAGQLIVKSIKDNSTDEERQLLSDVDALKRAVHANEHMLVQVEFTPYRRWPTVLVGPRHVNAPMDFMWRRVAAGAAVSATLYIDSSAGVPSADYMRSKLNVPRERLATHRPITPAWVTEPVTLYTPEIRSGESRAHRWCPPSGTEPDEADLARYHMEIASVIESISQEQDRGGMLVLATSYAFIAAMKASGKFGDNAIYQAEGVSLEVPRERFIRLSMDGQRPLWFATGSAWTGLNLAHPDASVAPEQDRILTHLVIVRAPFNTEKSSVSLARMERADGFMSEIMRCALQLKQAMGRLVRRPGLSDRHLYLLDPRMVDPGMSYGAIFERLVTRYPRRKLLSQTVDPVTASRMKPVPQTSKRRRGLI